MDKYGFSVAGAQWTAPKKSGGNSDMCVELAEVNGHIVVRDSQNSDRAHLSFSKDEFGTFLEAAKAGEYDDFVAA